MSRRNLGRRAYELLDIRARKDTDRAALKALVASIRRRGNLGVFEGQPTLHHRLLGAIERAEARLRVGRQR